MKSRIWFVMLSLTTICLVQLGCAEEKADSKSKTKDSGLKIEDLKEGSGEAARPGDVVSVQYTGWLKDGKKFDSSLDRGDPIEFKLGTGKVIRGWDEGLVGMKPGGKRKLIIPPDLAYGPGGRGDIPPNAELTFEVELVKIK